MKHFGFRSDEEKKEKRKRVYREKKRKKEKEEEEGEIICVFGGEIEMDGCDEGVGFVCSKQSCVITAVHEMTRKEQQYFIPLGLFGLLVLSLEY